jgi:hypothetical protein
MGGAVPCFVAHFNPSRVEHLVPALVIWGLDERMLTLDTPRTPELLSHTGRRRRTQRDRKNGIRR